MTLADQIMAATANPAKHVDTFGDPSQRRRVGNTLRNMILSARRFYMDDDATAAAATLGVQHPEILLEMLRRARAPFEKIWIEWPLKPQLEITHTALAATAPDRIGVFVERMDPEKPIYRMTKAGIITDGRGAGKNVYPSPLSVVYNLEDTFLPVGKTDLAIIEDSSGHSQKIVRGILLGSALKPDDDIEEYAFRQKIGERLVEHATFAVNHALMGKEFREMLLGLRGRDMQEVTQDIIRRELLEQAGTWRMVIAILALINSRDYVSSDTIRKVGKNRFVGGKVVPFLEHLVVGLKLPRKIVERKVIKVFSESIPRRRHEVIGHWKNSHKLGDPKCDHAYVHETDLREVCTFCGHKRWWVNEFERGDASIGYVTKDRKVIVE